jgi:dihydroxyacetone kinase
VLHAAGVAFADAAGGASGALWGAGLIAAGHALAGAGSGGDAAPAVGDVRRALEAAAEAVVRLGGAKPGEKTLLDALLPFVAAFGASGAPSVPGAWAAAVPAASAAAAATAELPGRRGRAATHGARSVGTPDPGAVSLALCLRAASESMSRTCAAARPDESAAGG